MRRKFETLHPHRIHYTHPLCVRLLDHLVLPFWSPGAVLRLLGTFDFIATRKAATTAAATTAATTAAAAAAAGKPQQLLQLLSILGENFEGGLRFLFMYRVSRKWIFVVGFSNREREREEDVNDWSKKKMAEKVLKGFAKIFQHGAGADYVLFLLVALWLLITCKHANLWWAWINSTS